MSCSALAFCLRPPIFNVVLPQYAPPYETFSGIFRCHFVYAFVIQAMWNAHRILFYRCRHGSRGAPLYGNPHQHKGGARCLERQPPPSLMRRKKRVGLPNCRLNPSDSRCIWQCSPAPGRRPPWLRARPALMASRRLWPATCHGGVSWMAVMTTRPGTGRGTNRVGD